MRIRVSEAFCNGCGQYLLAELNDDDNDFDVVICYKCLYKTRVEYTVLQEDVDERI